MEDYQIVLLISLGVAILIGIIFFICSCIYHVKAGTIMVIEKMQEYYGSYEKGWYWFWPFLYRRVGHYRINDEAVFRLNNGKKAKVKYTIVDVKKYHYSNEKITEYINKITLSKDDVTLKFLQDNLLTIGVNLENIYELN